MAHFVAVGAEQQWNRCSSLSRNCQFDVVEVRHTINRGREEEQVPARQRTDGGGIGCLDASELRYGLSAIEQSDKFIPIVPGKQSCLTFHDRSSEWQRVRRQCPQILDRVGAGRLSVDGDLGVVTAKGVYVVVYPRESQSLVEEAEISFREGEFVRRREPEHFLLISTIFQAPQNFCKAYQKRDS